VSAWESVRSAVEHMGSASFSLEDLAVIVVIWPQAFTCSWRVVALDSSKPRALHLIVAANLSQPTGAFTGGTQTQNRMNYFNELLAQWMEANRGLQIEANLGVLPPRPDGSSSANSSRSPKRKSALFQFSASERQELQARNNPSAIAITAAAAAERSAVSASGGIEQLRLEAIERQRLNKQREEQLNLERHKVANLTLIKSLPPLCDALRSLALARNKRSSFITTELLRELVLSLRISEAEVKARLAKLAAELPEFVTLLPADGRVAVDTVRVNLLVEYAEVRRKCQQLQEKA